jgi:nucleoside-diphosphate-sugar epimerase
MHVLMTGASGFIGLHLLRCLVHDGHTVTCLVRDRGRAEVNSTGGRDWRADLLDPATLSGLPADIDAVFHLAGGGRVSTVTESGLADLRRLNVETKRNLLAALPRPPRKLLLFSSVSAQGIRDGIVVREDTPCQPVSPHEIAKYESEREAEAWCGLHRVPLAILRPAQVYSPGDVVSEIPTMLRLVRLGAFPVFGAGGSLMVPLIHVSDVVELAVRALDLPFEGARCFGFTGHQYSVAETVRIFADVVGRRSGSLHLPKHLARKAAARLESLFGLAGAQPPLSAARIDNMTCQRVYDSSATHRELGFAPVRDLAGGIRETYAWYQAVGTRGLGRRLAEYLPIALAEGEGVGTAYEYLAKWRAIRTILPGVKRLLVAGLPEKYGSSLDFAALASALDAELVVADERAEALAKFEQALARARLSPRLVMWHVSLDAIADVPDPPFDLALSCEVVQRLDRPTRDRFVAGLARVARRIALFAPNAGNRAHATRSHLSSLSLDDMSGLMAPAGFVLEDRGYVDMPPFPPGLTLSQAKREQVKQARWQGLALAMLHLFCLGEEQLPPSGKRPFAHIVYAVGSVHRAGCASGD